MSTRDALGAITLAALLIGGCAAGGVEDPPPGWLPTTADRAESRGGYGAWVELARIGLSNRQLLAAGELIACDHDSTWVLAESGLVAVENRHAVARVTTARETSGGFVRGSFRRVRADDLQPWSRFPQGLPPGLDRGRLKPKAQL